MTSVPPGCGAPAEAGVACCAPAAGAALFVLGAGAAGAHAARNRTTAPRTLTRWNEPNPRTMRGSLPIGAVRSERTTPVEPNSEILAERYPDPQEVRVDEGLQVPPHASPGVAGGLRRALPIGLPRSRLVRRRRCGPRWPVLQLDPRRADPRCQIRH